MPLGEALMDAYDLHPPREEADWQIVMSHHRHKIINHRLQEPAVAKEADAIFVDGGAPYHFYANTNL